MSELDGFEVMPYIDQRTNKGKIASRDKRIEQLEGEIGGTRTISIPSLAFNYVNNRLESIGYQGELYIRERSTIPESESASRWHELFGTPERAARTLHGGTLICRECLIREQCAETSEDSNCMIMDYDALLEWLRGDAEWQGANHGTTNV